MNATPSFPQTQLLLERPAFDHSAEGRAQFVKSMREMAQHHVEYSSQLRDFWRWKKFSPQEIVDEASLERIPLIPVNLFKEHEWLTGDHSAIVLTLGSSGTAGQRSLMHLDQGSLARVKQLAYNVYAGLGITSPKRYNYLCFTYDPKIASDVGTAFTDELLTSFTDKGEVYYAIEWDGRAGQFRLNEEKCLAMLTSFAKAAIPCRILGFPAHLYHLIKKYDIRLTLPQDSWLQTGGGWKSSEKDSIPKDAFRALVQERLGILASHQRDLFGMVEHGIPYVDDEHGHLRIPNYGRVFIRDPYSMKLLPPGEVGLIQLMCSYNSSYPSFNILTTDWGRLRPVHDQWGAHTLELLGRAGIKKNMGCALKALETLQPLETHTPPASKGAP